MRKQFCDALVARSRSSNMVFLTGDLGFMALETLQEALGDRFINAGVSEQNMVSVSAALAREGFEVWVYSIAPFCYARPFEQIRNDVAFHGLPVKLVGNGGGYGYGVMGPTHHAIEDYGVLLTLPGMSAVVPVFDEDVEEAIQAVGDRGSPVYLRLGRGAGPKGYAPPRYAAWRQLVRGAGPTVVVAGPLAGAYVEAFAALAEERRPNLWAVAELPVSAEALPPELLEQIAESGRLCVFEEHVRQGGLGSQLAMALADAGVAFPKWRQGVAREHHYERSGSQDYLRRQSGLDAQSALAVVAEMMNGSR